MKANMWKSITAAAVAMVCGQGVASADTYSIWDFNVFSRSTIGDAGGGYGSSIQGAVGSVGSAWFSSYNGAAASGSSPSLSRAFYGGGDFTLSGSIADRGIETAGNVTMNNAAVTGPTYAGGNLYGAGGSFNGSVNLGGSKVVGSSVTVNGALNENTPYGVSVDVASVSTQFLGISDYAAGLAPNTSFTNQWGQLIINASEPLTVVTMDAATLSSAWGVKITGAGTVVINVPGSSLTMASKTWSYEGGASATTTLLNLNEATAFNLSGGNIVSILAPNAATNFSSGALTGNLVVGSLTGAGSVNWNSSGGFAGAVIPAPGSVALFTLGMLPMAARRRRA